MRFLKVVRFSSVGVFFAGIIGVIQGCSVEREGALFAALLFLLNFCSGPIEETTTGGAAPAAPPFPFIVLYDSERVGNGNIGDRATTTAICEASTKKPADYTRFIALLSYTGDAVVDFKNLPGFDATLPVTGPTGKPIGDNWDDLFDNSIITNLTTAIPGIPRIYWTGTSADGTTEANTCGEWTNSSGSGTGSNGHIGDPGVIDEEWIDHAHFACSNTVGLICVAY